MNRLNIAITGGIASGKSMASKFFQELGFYIIDADDLSRQIFTIGEKAYIDTIEYFGKDILLNDGNINRKMLGNIIFNDVEKRRILEEITHKEIWKKEKETRQKIYATNTNALIITDAALLIETGSYERYNPVILVYSSKETQLNRLCQRDNINENDALLRINSQMDIEEKLKYANIIIDNNSTIDNLQKEVHRVATLIQHIYYALNHK